MLYRKASILPNNIQDFQVPVLLAAVLLVGSNAFVLSPILSEVARGLATETFHVAWAISAFGMVTAVSALTLAGLIDRTAVGRVLGGAALLLAGAQILSGLSQNWFWLCGSQALAGVATGVLLPGTYATAATTAPTGREAARLGVVLAGWALSLVIAVPLAAIITEQFGWRTVYALLAGMSASVAVGLIFVLRGVPRRTAIQTLPWRALRLPGVARLLVVMFTYMTAFYGSFAFFGEGMRRAFGLSAQGAGIFVLAYGLGFGLAGVGLGRPKITRGYIMLILIAIATSYASWRLALTARPAAFVAAMVWGVLNQLGLNALVVSLNRRAAEANGAVMGLNSAVTYLAVFAGPIVVSPIYATSGFPGVSTLAAIFVLIGAVVGWKVK